MENKLKDICEGVFIKTEVMIYLTSVTHGYIIIQPWILCTWVCLVALNVDTKNLFGHHYLLSLGEYPVYTMLKEKGIQMFT